MTDRTHPDSGPITPGKDTEREAFEAFAKTDTSNVSLERDGDGYVDMAAALVWHGWEARAQLASQPAAQGWMPIETAPKDETEILVMYMHIDTQIVHNGFWLEGTGVDDEDIGWWSYDHSEVSRIKLDAWMSPIAWMPLPPPFAADGGEAHGPE